MKAARLALSFACSACTMVTGAGDYEVDAEKEQEVRDMVAMSMVRDLDYGFADMDTHPDQTLDVAVVDSRDVLQARARVVLPKLVDGMVPTERFVMKRALTPGPYTLYFYADSNGDNVIQGSRARIEEHIWVEPAAPSGTGTFTHNLNFIFFSADEFTQNQNLVLERPLLSDLPGLTPDQAFMCFAKLFTQKFENTFEVKVYLASEMRQQGYFKVTKGGTLPAGFEIHLDGIIDEGNMYHFEVLFDGIPHNEFTAPATPENGEWRIPAKTWLDLEPRAIDCR
jgi:hypothetical protein